MINLAEDIKSTSSRLFITKYSTLFMKYLADLDDNTKHIIKNNKQLDGLYDLFIDFIIDSSQHLDYTIAKEQEKDVGSN